MQKNIILTTLKERKKIIIAVLAVVTAMVMFLVTGFFSKVNFVAHGQSTLEIQTVLEMNETSLSTQLSGIVKEVYANEGDIVQKEQLLAVIDDEELQIKKVQVEASIESIIGQVQGAQANLLAADARLKQIMEGARPEEILQIEYQYEMAENNFQRMESLYSGGAISLTEYESALANRDILKARYDLIIKGATSSEIQAAQASVSGAAASVRSLEGQLKSAQSSLADIERQLKYTQIIAPADGILTQLNIKPGELVGNGVKVASIMDNTNAWLECSVKETDLSKVQLGQRVNIRFGAYEGNIYSGKVVSINEKADFATRRATNETGSFDIRAYGVKIELDEVDVPLYVGMTAFVSFEE